MEHMEHREEHQVSTQGTAASNAESGQAPAGAGSPQAPPPTNDRAELMGEESRERYRHSWGDIQTAFVDEPRQAVERAEQLVGEVIQYLARTFADERARLEDQWSRGEVDTEQLRVALQRYRKFFGSLLNN
jgi:hypothetical protein